MPERLQVAVVLIWIKSIMGSSDNRKKAMQTRERLISELKEIEKFLGVDDDGKRVKCEMWGRA